MDGARHPVSFCLQSWLITCLGGNTSIFKDFKKHACFYVSVTLKEEFFYIIWRLISVNHSGNQRDLLTTLSDV